LPFYAEYVRRTGGRDYIVVYERDEPLRCAIRGGAYRSAANSFILGAYRTPLAGFQAATMWLVVCSKKIGDHPWFVPLRRIHPGLRDSPMEWGAVTHSVYEVDRDTVEAMKHLDRLMWDSGVLRMVEALPDSLVTPRNYLRAVSLAAMARSGS